MKTIKTKNLLRKSLLFVALSGLFACATVAPMNLDINSINETNIHTIPNETIEIILKNDATAAQKLAKCITKKNIMDAPVFLIVNTDKSTATTCASCITKDNIKDCQYQILYILRADRSCAKTFASYITKDNIKDNQLATLHIIDADQDCAEIIVKKAIDKDNIANDKIFIMKILGSNKDCAKIFTSYITKDTIKNNLELIRRIIDTDKDCAKIFASYITKDNIRDTQYAVGPILDTDNSYVTTFASYITKDNIKDTQYAVGPILDTDKSYATIFASYITKDNYTSIPQRIYEFLIECGLDIKAKLKEYGYSPKEIKTNPLDSYIFAGNKYNTTIYLNKISNVVTKIESSEKTFNNNHFATTFEIILSCFDHHIKPVEIRYSLADIKKQEKIELEKGRYQIYHGRSSKAFVCNNVFKKILEIYYSNPIKKSWYTMHHKFPHQYTEYDSAIEIKKTGNSCMSNYTKERDHMQFASDLFGCKAGSSALDYVLDNRNVDIYRGIIPIDQMFELLAVELRLQKNALQKYYLRYKDCFDMLYLLEKQFKYGTLLMYSLDKEILSNFTFVTHNGSGKKDIPISIDGIGDTLESKDVLDTLLNNPEKFNRKDKKYEYVFVMGQDHENDKNKLGTTNPFNSKIDIYQFNFGADKKIAHAIQRGIDLLFYNQIIPDMIKDGVIKDTGAFKKEKINFEKEITIQSKL